MKRFTLYIFAILTYCEFTAAACPDFDGQYRFAEEPWNGSIRVEQKDCVHVTVTWTRKVASSARHPDGIWIVKEILKVDGQAYVGFTNSTRTSTPKTRLYQRASWKNGRLVLQQFAGAAEDCPTYAYNREHCHMMDYVLMAEPNGEFAWYQTGIWWNEGGEHGIDRYVLHKMRNPFNLAVR